MALPNYTTVGQGGFDLSGNFYRPTYTASSGGLPDYGSGHPFLDPNYTYGGNPDIRSTPFFDLTANNDPAAYYALWLAEHGYDTMGQQSKLARGLYDRFQQGFAGAQLLSPELHWTDYLSQQNIGNQIDSLSYQNQGINVGQYQGRDRWGLRSG